MAESLSTIRALIRGWLFSRVSPEGMAWIDDRDQVITGGDKKSLYLGFGMVPRKIGKADLNLSDSELAQARKVRPGWNPSGWSLDQLARIYFVLGFPSADAAAYESTLNQLFQTGEVGELIALYQALPLLPNPSTHVLRTAEGIRSNIKPVFCAIAHRNPYPSEQLNDEQWNQLVLKCLFIDLPLAEMVGVDERANATLMSILVDFAHERRAAHRAIPPELWRCVGPFADDRALDDLRLVLTTGTLPEQRAAALALSQSPSARAKTILAECPGIARAAETGEFSWTSLLA